MAEPCAPGNENGLDVVIVSYRSGQRLERCLEALRAHAPRRPTRIVVVDNASDDGTPERIRAAFPEAELIALGSNVGFARANNVAIARSRSEYVLVLNPDTQVSAGALDHMLALMDERPEIGIAGCRLVREDGSFDHAARRSFPTVLSAFGHFTGIGRRRRTGRLAAYRAPEIERGRVDAVNGAFMLVRRAALDEVGAFDEGYWMYMEDLDLCYRFARAGWVTWYEPDSVVVHAKGRASGRHRSPRLDYAFHYGMYRFYRKFYAPDKGAVANGLVYGAIALKLLLSLARTAIHVGAAATNRRPGPSSAEPGALERRSA